MGRAATIKAAIEGAGLGFTRMARRDHPTERGWQAHVPASASSSASVQVFVFASAEQEEIALFAPVLTGAAYRALRADVLREIIEVASHFSLSKVHQVQDEANPDGGIFGTSSVCEVDGITAHRFRLRALACAKAAHSVLSVVQHHYTPTG